MNEEKYFIMKINNRKIYITINNNISDILGDINKDKDSIIINIINDSNNSNTINNNVFNIYIVNYLNIIKNKKIYELTEFDKMIIIFSSNTMSVIKKYLINTENIKSIILKLLK